MFVPFIYLLTISIFSAILYIVSVKVIGSRPDNIETLMGCVLLSILWPLVLTLALILLPSMLAYKYLNRESNNVQK